MRMQRSPQKVKSALYNFIFSPSKSIAFLVRYSHYHLVYPTTKLLFRRYLYYDIIMDEQHCSFKKNNCSWKFEFTSETRYPGTRSRLWRDSQWHETSHSSVDM